jgi:hypothetical protein
VRSATGVADEGWPTVTGTDGNPWCLLNVNSPFGPPQNGYGAGVYGPCGAMQWKLRSEGYNIGPSGDDGRWGPYTRTALQVHLNQVIDGTWDSGDVVALQNRCAAVGFPCTPDGSWGPKTSQAVNLSLNSTRF